MNNNWMEYTFLGYIITLNSMCVLCSMLVRNDDWFLIGVIGVTVGVIVLLVGEREKMKAYSQNTKELK